MLAANTIRNFIARYRVWIFAVLGILILCTALLTARALYLNKTKAQPTGVVAGNTVSKPGSAIPNGTLPSTGQPATTKNTGITTGKTATSATNTTNTTTSNTESTASSTSGSGNTSTGTSGGGASTPKTLHYAVNIGSQQSLATSLGFNLFDITGSTSNPSGVNTTINSLPAGTLALVWVGNLDNTNCTPGFSYSQFTAQVDALKNNSRVFGYYLSDEPHPSICANAASDIQARADYIKANAAGQKSFIVVLDGSSMCGANLGCEYSALAPANTHVDFVGLDPYPCHYAADGVTPVACDNSAITTKVNSAISSGIPVSSIIPVYQTFGQSGRIDGKTVYYRMPTTTELTDMINTWNGLVPNPVFDYAYSFGVQCTVSSCPAPQAIANHSEIQTIITAQNQ